MMSPFPRFRQAVPPLLLVVGAVVSFYLAASLQPLRPVNAQGRVAQPFYLKRTIFTDNHSGKLSPFRAEVVARRSDGATARITSLGPLTAPGYFRKVDFLDGRSVTLIDSIKAKSTWPTMGRRELSALSQKITQAPADCGVHTPYALLRFDSLDGQDVVVAEGVIAKRYRLTRWLAPKLGCEDLYYKSEALSTDGTSSVSSEARVSDLTLGEPDPSLFDLGVEYKEMKPSQAQDLLLKRIGLSLSPPEAQGARTEAKQADALYERGQKPQ
jgi:hypothetical protein